MRKTKIADHKGIALNPKIMMTDSGSVRITGVVPHMTQKGVEVL